jgi:hypothetical protein
VTDHGQLLTTQALPTEWMECAYGLTSGGPTGTGQCQTVMTPPSGEAYIVTDVIAHISSAASQATYTSGYNSQSFFKRYADPLSHEADCDYLYFASGEAPNDNVGEETEPITPGYSIPLWVVSRPLRRRHERNRIYQRVLRAARGCKLRRATITSRSLSARRIPCMAHDGAGDRQLSERSSPVVARAKRRKSLSFSRSSDPRVGARHPAARHRCHKRRALSEVQLEIF